MHQAVVVDTIFFHISSFGWIHLGIGRIQTSDDKRIHPLLVTIIVLNISKSYLMAALLVLNPSGPPKMEGLRSPQNPFKRTDIYSRKLPV